MRVETHYGGSDVVVWITEDHYIDSRRNVRLPHLRIIEAVRHGQVYLREPVGLWDAPERLIELMKETVR